MMFRSPFGNPFPDPFGRRGGGLGPELTDNAPDLINPQWTNVGGVYTYDDTGTGRIGWDYTAKNAVCRLAFTIAGNTAVLAVFDYSGAVTYHLQASYPPGNYALIHTHTGAGIRITGYTLSGGAFTLTNLSHRQVL